MNTPIEDGLSIRWEQSQQVVINVDQDTKSIWTTKHKVEEVLAEAGIKITKHDVVSPALDEQLGKEDSITVNKAFVVTLNDGGEEKKVRSTSTTVADFLKRENIHLNADDRLNRKADGSKARFYSGGCTSGKSHRCSGSTGELCNRNTQ